MNNQRMVFDLEVIEVPVSIGKNQFVIREADGGTTATYRNMLTDATEFTDGRWKSVV